MDHVQKSLLEVKAYYVSLLADYELKIAHVKKQILHVEALLPDFLPPEASFPPLSLQIQDQDSGFPQPQVVSDIVDAIIDAESNEESNEENNYEYESILADIETEEDVATEDVEIEFPQCTLDTNANSTSTNLNTQDLTDLPVSGNYRRIYSVFKENKERILHFQYILLALRKNAGLQESEISELKKRLRWELAYGVKRGFWHKVVGEESCYVLGRQENDAL